MSALIFMPFALLSKSKRQLAAENAGLRHQLAVLQRKIGGRSRLMGGNGLFEIDLDRWFPSVL
jgi:hypothetical protein